MSTPGPQILINGADAARILVLAQKCQQAVQEVEGYLLSGDVNGATEYMEDFQREHGKRAHDAVMKMLEEIYRSPDWRTIP